MEEQALDGFVDDEDACEEQEPGFDEGRKVFDFAMAVLVVGVGGFVGEAHGKEGDGGGDQVEKGVGGFRQNAEAAGGDADDNLERGDGYGRYHRVGGYGAFFGAHGS